MYDIVMTEARDWLEDCFSDLPDDLSDKEAKAGVDRYYDGGWAAFLRATLLIPV